jgi:hypothetical protein
MNPMSSRRQHPEAAVARDNDFVNLIGRAFLHAFGGSFGNGQRSERPVPCRQEDYDQLEHNRRERR